MTGHSNPRNKELMRIFKDLGMVEQLGSGMPRILKIYPKECFRFTPNFLRITLPVNSDVMKQLEADKVAEADAGILGSGRMLKKGSEKGSEKDSEKKVNQLIRLLSVNPEITTSGISDELEISTRMVEKYISLLKKDGKIVRIGGRKTGHWEVLDELMR